MANGRSGFHVIREIPSGRRKHGYAHANPFYLDALLMSFPLIIVYFLQDLFVDLDFFFFFFFWFLFFVCNLTLAGYAQMGLVNHDVLYHFSFYLLCFFFLIVVFPTFSLSFVSYFFLTTFILKTLILHNKSHLTPPFKWQKEKCNDSDNTWFMHTSFSLGFQKIN